ncbi:LysM peptidoglycan-binding domain-containing protein [Pseudarthrobacter sp. NIBRBAC000502770]|uniref:LysM peptidoglycan-binding domain-containing protein n=1 Tax=Pseudarthrobacter sp. NIBRBAC000502770 TaxID=2590785 RepID=UPI0011405974|nr:LysM peptidoglycan-binding domain-containing protein [Pseudarthrobacter sp. NIBRBAC000502770]QDG88876.1 LysM peptidoglycan-binding domain-containing protein [Pseudarthrobacter sp. NIBRBAC000502770]
MILSNLANVLRNAGINVVEIDGWQNRGYLGRDLADVRGVLWHHTAAGRNFSEDAPSLNICTNGRSDLAGPLCHIVLGRSGTAYITAAGLANHAGAGSAPGIPTDAGNYYFIGIEMESSGVAPFDWTAEQLAAVPVIGAALERAYLFDQAEDDRPQLGHKEYSSQGKIDPAGWPGDCDGLRASINAVLGTGSVSLPAGVVPQSYTPAPVTTRPSGYAECTVDPGDTLSRIADQYHVGLAELLGVNPQITDPNLIGIGDVLNLPAGAYEDAPAAPAPAAPAAGGQCTVSAGDSLSSIGAQVGVAWQDIAALNGIGEPYTIQPGQTLDLPAGANLAALGTTPAAPTAPSGLPPYCTVDPGDTLGGIADQYGVTVDYLITRNPGINPDLIYPGQRINLQ